MLLSSDLTSPNICSSVQTPALAVGCEYFWRIIAGPQNVAKTSSRAEVVIDPAMVCCVARCSTYTGCLYHDGRLFRIYHAERCRVENLPVPTLAARGTEGVALGNGTSKKHGKVIACCTGLDCTLYAVTNEGYAAGWRENSKRKSSYYHWA